MRIGISTAITDNNGPNYIGAVPLDPDQVIRDLFGPTDVGAWYDPSDSSTVFQDAAGTTPATVGDPVGLILDKSKGGVDSVNQFPSTSASDWTVYGSNTISDEADGSVLITYADNADGGFIRISNFYAGLLDTAVSHQIRLEAKVSTGTVQIRLNGETPVASQSITGTNYQDYSFVIKWDGTTSIMSLQALGMGAGESINIRNIRVYELPGNHATQTTSAARPVLQSAGGLYYLDFDGVDDWISTTFGASIPQPLTFAAGALWADSTSTAAIHWSSVSGFQTYSIKNSSNMQMSPGGIVYAEPDGVSNNVWVQHFDAASFYLRKDGSAQTPISGSSTGTTSLDSLRLAINPLTSVSPHASRWYGVVLVDRTLTAGEISDLESYLATKSGVTL